MVWSEQHLMLDILSQLPANASSSDVVTEMLLATREIVLSGTMIAPNHRTDLDGAFRGIGESALTNLKSVRGSFGRIRDDASTLTIDA